MSISVVDLEEALELVKPGVTQADEASGAWGETV
jgi:hypothetical protein